MHKGAIFILFGGTGDLTKKKLVPAFAELLVDGILTEHSSIIGIARGDFTDESYKELLIASARNEHEKECVRKVKVHFYKADSTQPGALTGLTHLIQKIEPNGSCDRIYYLAVGYKLFDPILKNLVAAKLDKHPRTKIVFEKPFGSDYASAKKLEHSILSVFSENQIYRIDHYLGKETVQNLSILKFANPFFSHLLSNQFVTKIDILADEDVTVGSRLGYYDTAGAIKDMIQSHLLQVAALVLMDTPTSLDADAIHTAKTTILKKLKLGPIAKQTIGQYETYVQELSNAKLPLSKTETFANLSFICDTKRWRGVEIVLQTGKALHQKHGKVIVHFKEIGKGHEFIGLKENKLVIDIHPTENIRLFINTKKRFASKHLEYVPLDFCGDCLFGPNTTDGYKRLIQDILVGDMTLFTRHEEVLQSWKIIENVEKQKNKMKFKIYKNGSNPKEFL